MNRYQNLFKPLDLGFIKLPNRFVMGAMHTGLEEQPEGFERLAKFYTERIRGGAGLIITGGISPNPEGMLTENGPLLCNSADVAKHEWLTQQIHQEGGLICMQILHAGRYAYHAKSVAPSRMKAAISKFEPHELTDNEIEKQISDFVNCALLAKEAGYNGIEIMGSEGYLINQFIAARTNKRNDKWGGDFSRRVLFPLEILSRTRKAVGSEFLMIYRLSLLDLVEEGSTWHEISSLAKKIVDAGVNIINSGIGWHESRVPTIAGVVPRAGFLEVTAKIKKEVSIPVIAANRINDPAVAESILESKAADLVSMARPFLADPEFVKKAAKDRALEINSCIACNQSCLDNAFLGKSISCLVNPRACNETILNFSPAKSLKKIAVIGAGPAGATFSYRAASRGHKITLFEASAEIGGQFNLAKRIPGKEEFNESLRYLRTMLDIQGVQLNLNCRVTEQELLNPDFDEIVIATGVKPAVPEITGVQHRKVISYIDAITGKKPIGKTVAIVGAGGIGVDVAMYLVNKPYDSTKDFAGEWGIDFAVQSPGGLQAKIIKQPERKIYLLQRKSGKISNNLGKTTGWIHIESLKNKGVEMLTGIEYKKIDDDGLHIILNGEERIITADTVIICAGQLPLNEFEKIQNINKIHFIGGANSTKNLDAEQAIKEAAYLASQI